MLVWHVIGSSWSAVMRSPNSTTGQDVELQVLLVFWCCHFDDYLTGSERFDEDDSRKGEFHPSRNQCLHLAANPCVNAGKVTSLSPVKMSVMSLICSGDDGRLIRRLSSTYSTETPACFRVTSSSMRFKKCSPTTRAGRTGYGTFFPHSPYPHNSER